MKKEIISLVLQILCVISCVVCTVVVDEDFTRGLYASCAAIWGVISGMTLKGLLVENE